MSDDREWHNLTKKLRRKLAREGQYLVITRGANPQMMIFNVQPNTCDAGPVLANTATLRRWLEQDR